MRDRRTRRRENSKIENIHSKKTEEEKKNKELYKMTKLENGMRRIPI